MGLMAKQETSPKPMADQNVSFTVPWRVCESDFNLGRHLIPFLQDVPFYAELSRNIAKKPTHDIPTAAITFDPKEDEFVLWYNPVFLGGGEYFDKQMGETVKREALTNFQIRGTLTHEFKHVVFGHLAERRPIDPKTADDWNVAADLAINSLIEAYSGHPRDLEPGQEALPLPKEGLIPGRYPYIDPERFAKLSPMSQEATLRRAKLIEGFPKLKASEWYFNALQEDRQNGNSGGSGDGDDVEYALGPMDSHDGWDGVPEELLEYVEGKAKQLVEKAVRHADGQADGWGNIPAELQAEIRRSVSNIVNWRSVLRQFIGSIVRGNRMTSIKRINRRFPYVHPGTKRGYTAKLFVAIDESGSVNDEMLEMFFSELDALTRKVSITLCHFDCYAGPKDLYEWRRGMRPRLQRTKGGGTDFNAPTNIVNDPKNRGRWDGMLIMTDGQAPEPGPSRVKRGWILGQGCKLYFTSNELQIFLSNEQQVRGAWR